MVSFLKSVDSFLKLIPDHKPEGVSEKIRSKCSVLYFPLQFPFILEEETTLTSEITSTLKNRDIACAEAQRISVSTAVEVVPQIQPTSDQSNASASSSTVIHSSSQCPQKPLSIDSKAEYSLTSSTNICSADGRTPLHIVWPHRW